MSEKLYTDEQLRLALLEQSNTGVLESLKEIKQELRSQFHWTMGTMSVLFISLIGTLVTALARSLSWF